MCGDRGSGRDSVERTGRVRPAPLRAANPLTRYSREAGLTRCLDRKKAPCPILATFLFFVARVGNQKITVTNSALPAAGFFNSGPQFLDSVARFGGDRKHLVQLQALLQGEQVAGALVAAQPVDLGGRHGKLAP